MLSMGTQNTLKWCIQTRKNRLVSHFNKGLDPWFFVKLWSIIQKGVGGSFRGFISLYIVIGSCKGKRCPKARQQKEINKLSGSQALK